MSDLVEGGHRLLLAPNPEPLIVNLGNPDEVTILQMAAEILELTGSRSKISFRPLPEDDPKVRRPSALSLVMTLLGRIAPAAVLAIGFALLWIAVTVEANVSRRLPCPPLPRVASRDADLPYRSVHHGE